MSVVKWSREEVDAFIQCCLKTINFNVAKDIELRARMGTGTEDLFHLGSSCCEEIRQDHLGDSTSAHDDSEHHCHKWKEKPFRIKYQFKKKDDDHIGDLLDSLVQESGLKYMVEEIAEKASTVLINVIRKSSATDRPTDTELKTLREEILRESIIRTILSHAHRMRLESHSSDAKEGGFLATPGSYLGGSLDYLQAATLANLMKKGYAIQDGFMGEEIRAKILREVELIEFDGQLREMKNTTLTRVAHRQDRMCWLRKSQIDRDAHQGLFALVERLGALPFELNKKVGLFCQVGTVLQLAVFPATGAKYSKHMDSGFTQRTNTGRKITVLNYPNDPNWAEKDGGFLHMHPPICRTLQEENENLSNTNKSRAVSSTSSAVSLSTDSTQPDETSICPKGDRLVIFKSRIMPHEVLPAHRKRFAITLWISGPMADDDDMQI